MRVECEAELNKTIADVEEFMLTNGFTETTVRTYWYNWKQIEKHAIEKGYSCFSREWMLDFAYSKCSDPNARRKRQVEYNRIRAANLLADFIEYKAVSHSLNFVPDNPLRIVVRSAKAAMKALNYSESSIEKFEDIGYHLAEYGHANGYFEFKSEWIMAAVPKVFESTSEMTSRAQRRCLRPAEILCHFNKFGSIPGKMAVSKTFPAKYDALIQAKELYCETHRLSEACRHSFNVTCNDFAAYLVNSNITLEMLNIDMVRKYFIEKSYHATSSKKLLRYVFRSLFKTAYAEQNGMEVVGESFDDNVSGMTFTRKGLGQLEEAVAENKIDVVLVKDLSRLGRHRTQTALFIDHLRENNVKVYSVTEGIDTTNENDDLRIGFKQIFNDFYAKDISKKVRAGMRQKQKSNGLVLTLPLGYYLDRNTNKIEIDDSSAEIVREVFKLYTDGYGFSAIAKQMNERGIHSPEYHQNRRLADCKPAISKRYLWVQTAVKRILTNELYIGTMVNHKTVTSKIYKTKTDVAQDEQYRHEDFCEPIIDRTTWEQAQFLLRQRSETKPRASGGNKIHRYSGLIRCAECGSCFVAKTRKWCGREYIEYTCNGNHRYGKNYCTPHRVREALLDEVLGFEIENLRDFIMAESERYEQIIKEWLKRKPQYEQKNRSTRRKNPHPEATD